MIGIVWWLGKKYRMEEGMKANPTKVKAKEGFSHNNLGRGEGIPGVGGENYEAGYGGVEHGKGWDKYGNMRYVGHGYLDTAPGYSKYPRYQPE